MNKNKERKKKERRKKNKEGIKPKNKGKEDSFVRDMKDKVKRSKLFIRVEHIHN